MCVVAKTEEFEDVYNVPVWRDTHASKSPKPEWVPLGAAETTAIVLLPRLFERGNRVCAFVAEATNSAVHSVPNSASESLHSPVLDSGGRVGFSLALLAPDADLSVCRKVLRRPTQAAPRTPAAVGFSGPFFVATTVDGRRFSPQRWC